MGRDILDRAAPSCLVVDAIGLMVDDRVESPTGGSARCRRSILIALGSHVLDLPD